MTSIDAASQKDAGLLAVQIGRAKEVLGGTMSVTITPSLVDIGLAAFQ